MFITNEDGTKSINSRYIKQLRVWCYSDETGCKVYADMENGGEITLLDYHTKQQCIDTVYSYTEQINKENNNG